MDEKIVKLEKKLEDINLKNSADPLDKIRVLNALAWELRHADIHRAYQLTRQAQEMLEKHHDPREWNKNKEALAEIQPPSPKTFMIGMTSGWTTTFPSTNSGGC